MKKIENVVSSRKKYNDPHYFFFCAESMYLENWPNSQRLYTSSFNPEKYETLIGERKAIVWNVLNVIWILKKIENEYKKSLKEKM